MVGTVGRGGLLNETLMIRESLFVDIELSSGVERRTVFCLANTITYDTGPTVRMTPNYGDW